MASKLSNIDKVIENRFFERDVSSEEKTVLSMLVILKKEATSDGDETINLLLCSINGGNIPIIKPATIAIIIMYVSAILKTFGSLNLTKRFTKGERADTKITATNKIISRSLIR